MTGKYEKLKNNTLIFTVGSMASSIITFLLLPLLTNKLTTTQYGEIDFINITITLLIPIISLNIVEAILRFGVDNGYKDSHVLSTALITFFVFFSVVFIVVISIVSIFKLNHKIIYVLGLILLGSIYPMLQNFCRSIGKVKQFAIADVLYATIFGVANIVFVRIFEMGINGYFDAYIIANILAILYLIIIVRIYKYISIRAFNIRYCKEFIYYSVPLIPNSLSWWIVDVSDRYLITIISGISSLGIYSIANKIPSIIKICYGMFFKAWQISSIEEFNNDKTSEFYSKILSYLIKTMFTVSMLIIVSLPIIMRLFIGKEFYSAIYYIPILATSIVFYTFSAFLGTIYTASKNTKGILKTTIVSAILNIVINIIFMPRYGAIVASFSTLISYIYMFIHRYIDSKKYINIVISFKDIIIPCVFLLIQAIIIIIINNYVMEIILCFIIFILYSLSNVKEVKMIKDIFKNRMKRLN